MTTSDMPGPTRFGIGQSVRRVEDRRFVTGRARYVADIRLAGCTFAAIVRSPFAHARILGYDIQAALEAPGVVAVLTGQDVVADDLHGFTASVMPEDMGGPKGHRTWRPILATDKARFVGEAVSIVVAATAAHAADAADLVEVDYEPLDSVTHLEDASADGAVQVHEDCPNGNMAWGLMFGDQAATDAAFKKAEVSIKELISYQRVHPCPLETCQCVALFDKIRGELTVWGTFQAPHVIRTVASLISKIPEQKIHVIAPDIGGGFGNKVGAYPGYICAAVASIVTGKPVKWVEDRIENLTATSFARDYT